MIDFIIATLPTGNLHLQRPQWGRQIEKSYDRVQSGAVTHPVTVNISRWPGV